MCGISSAALSFFTPQHPLFSSFIKFYINHPAAIQANIHMWESVQVFAHLPLGGVHFGSYVWGGGGFLEFLYPIGRGMGKLHIYIIIFRLITWR